MKPTIYACLLLATFSNAISVYLHPPPSPLQRVLSPAHASIALSRHLSLETFEPLGDLRDLYAVEQEFVAQGPTDALLLTVNEQDAPGTQFSSNSSQMNVSPMFTQRCHPRIHKARIHAP